MDKYSYPAQQLKETYFYTNFLEMYIIFIGSPAELSLKMINNWEL